VARRCLGQLGALEQLTLMNLSGLKEIPDLIGLTALVSLYIRECHKIKTLASLGSWGRSRSRSRICQGCRKW